MEKKASLAQPLSIRRDYDDVEGAMLKPLPPTPPPTPQEALIENVAEIIPSTPQGKMDYDDPTPIMPEEKECGGPMGPGPVGGGPMGKGFDIECPVCRDTNKFIPEAEEDMGPKMIILCPKCANSSRVGDFVKTASGIFRAKVATSLDADFTAIKKLLPKNKDSVNLSNSDVAFIHGKLDKIYNTYRKFERELRI